MVSTLFYIRKIKRAPLIGIIGDQKMSLHGAAILMSTPGLFPSYGVFAGLSRVRWFLDRLFWHSTALLIELP